MKTSTDFPPNYKQIVEAFPVVAERKEAIFCYGDTIYNPFNRKITPDLTFHESIHTRQQGNNPEEWWMYYIKNEEFRLDQEIEAYGEQYAFVMRHIPNNRVRRMIRDSMSTALSGDTYGKLLSFNEAETLISRYAKEKLEEIREAESDTRKKV